MLEDEICVLARRMQAGGAKGVRLDGYEGMPHCFGMILMGGAMGRKCMGSWAGFIKDVVEGKGGESKATWAKALSNPVSKVEVEFEELKKELSDEEVARLMGGKRDRCVQKEEGMVREWRERGGQDPPKSKL